LTTKNTILHLLNTTHIIMNKLLNFFRTTPEVYSDELIEILKSNEKLDKLMKAIEHDQNPKKDDSSNDIIVKRVGSNQVELGGK
jgi:hypothetical protein